MSIILKKCKKCGQVLPLSSEFFAVDNSKSDGYNISCKTCINSYFKNYYNENKERINDIRRNDYNKDKRRKKYINEIETAKKYYVENKSLIKASNKNYYYDNREEKLAYASNYSKTKSGSEIRKIYNQKRIATLRNLTSTYTLKEWKYAKQYFENKCAYCGKQVNSLAKEHIVPLLNGGGYTKENILPACVKCNSSKGTNTMGCWYINYKYFSIERYNKILKYIDEARSDDDEKNHKTIQN